MKKSQLLIIMWVMMLSGLSLQAQNNCLTFPGSTAASAIATVPSTTALGFATGGFTIEAWIYPTAWRTNYYEGTIVNKEDDNISTGWAFRCGQNGILSFNMCAPATVWNECQTPAGTLVLNAWQHVAAVYNGTTMYVYVNGVQKAYTAITAASIPTNTKDVGIGQWTWDATSRYFPGKIDEVRLWNTPLSESTIKAWCDKTIVVGSTCHPNNSNLLAYYQMDDASNSAVLKATIGADGAITNGATYGLAGNSSFTGLPSGSYATADQASTAVVLQNVTNKEIIRIAVEPFGTGNLTQLKLRTDGTTSVGDITNAKIWCTGTSSVFATGTQFGSTIATPPAAGIDMDFNGSYAMSGCGTYFFWLTYDIPSGATLGNVVDGKLQSVVVNGSTLTPLVSDPAGNRSISIDFQVDIGGAGSNNTSYLPISASQVYSYSQQIYLGSEFTTGGGGGTNVIKKIRFYCNTATTNTNWNTWAIYMGNTSKTAFTGLSDWVPAASMTQVFNGTINQPVSGSWFEITLTTPFTYTGGNLVVACDENTPLAGSTTNWRYNFGMGNRSMYYYSSTVNPDPASPPSAYSYSSANLNNVQFIMTPLANAMTFSSATTLQASTAIALPGSTNQAIIGLQVVTAGNTSPLSLTQLSMVATGTNPTADISKIHVYYTGTSSTFAATNAFDGTGTTVASGTITINGTQALASGTNYFWIAYDISATATNGNMVDAMLLASPTNTMVVGGTGRTVTVNDPTGSRTIIACTPPSAPTIGTITQPTCTVATGSVVLNNLPATGNWTIMQSPGSVMTTGTGTTTTILSLVPGTYTFTVSVIANCPSAATAQVIINPQPATPPTPVISQAGSILHSSATSGNQWFNQAGLISGAVSQNYTLTANGDYYDIVTLNGCSSDTSNILHVTTYGIEDNLLQSKINIYPNPANDKLFVNFGEIKKIPQGIKIINTLGQVVFETLKPMQVNVSGIDVSYLNRGVYTLEIIFDKGIVNKTIIVK